MKTSSMWVIKLALAVQFACVLAVPSLVASQEAPRAMWMAEWVRPGVAERAIGVLRLRDGKLTFAEQAGQAHWEIELAAVKRAAPANGGKALAISTVTGEDYVVVVMEANLTNTSPKKLQEAIERALQALAAGR